MIRVHGTAVALDGAGILLSGPSGAGKSDLALRLIDEGAALIADDQTELCRVGAGLRMTAPATIAGLIEVRGIGILRVRSAPSAQLRLVATLVLGEAIERLPEPRCRTYLDCAVPEIALAPFEASATAKLRLALRAVLSSSAMSSAS